MNILDEIAEKTRQRIDEAKKQISYEELLERARMKASASQVPSFLEALKKPGISYICEVKKASPSKGVIAKEFPYLEIAADYEKAGASAVSCLTEPNYFKGSDRYLEEITETIHLPVLRKDFFVDPYMIAQARLLGASAVLLIVSLLTKKELKTYFNLTEELGMDALFEAHNEEEIRIAIECGAKIIGVNNRNLKDFTVDPHNSVNLRKYAPKDVVFVAESGIKTHKDIKLLQENGIDAVLIGETLMKAKDKTKKLQELNGDVPC
ncbi:MAG: indole-3-glycerol phosphate synthase TrpC [Lachnospiraceae bacterium]|nr:indole-3-glycerol phosphate synthase TrpC [Lachnospiraceae bacterium]